MVRTSLMTLRVDLCNGRYRVFSRGEQRLFGTIETESTQGMALP